MPHIPERICGIRYCAVSSSLHKLGWLRTVAGACLRHSYRKRSRSGAGAMHKPIIPQSAPTPGTLYTIFLACALKKPLVFVNHTSILPAIFSVFSNSSSNNLHSITSQKIFSVVCPLPLWLDTKIL